MQQALPQHVILNKPARILAPVQHMRAVLGAEGIFGLLLLSLLVAAAGLAPVLAPYDPDGFAGRPLERPAQRTAWVLTMLDKTS